MKKRFSKQYALLVFGLLLIGMSLACFVWVRKEQRQYALNRDLIDALLKHDTKQALVLVEAGADPNTRQEPSPAPSLPMLIEQLLHHAPPQANTSRTAFLIACGSGFTYEKGAYTAHGIPLFLLDPRLTQAMLLHGANIHAMALDRGTALHYRVISALYNPSSDYKANKEIITQLLDAGADPDEADRAYLGTYGGTPMKSTLVPASLRLSPHPDLVALLRKYSKQP